ncbi:hypothetical protein A3C37_01395 [Candidatus Peribacteria bacterium RIFCSPHIGHO2_02_FULL_53_20]|nr:MAG: hypothetical protein A3C37_01395 [Candidatus Peribacteria bacterium RIFCSPHIGHO2_02_FULL_53_20]OGJ67617.1 MAG: hypothetical protein A3B61_02035 [Candidatus Peribacteria bacterium RIFCSPLOWO2_01_FULL_53_10]OGJ74995.1 MAG: hypothetical protein A3G69_00710 [Candidatus Peribacteria bacterium RIFCSPLOWO2_12_FULL_53_10]
MLAGNVSTPALDATLDAFPGGGLQEETVQEGHVQLSANGKLLPIDILRRVIAAFKRIPGMEMHMATLITDPALSNLSQDQVLDSLTARALELPAIQKIVGEDGDRLRRIIERAGAMSDNTVRQYPIDPFVVTHQNGHPDGALHFGLVETELGRGGCGYVERVLYEGRELARKVFDPDKRTTSNVPKLRERFVGEYEVLRQLGDIVPHPEFAEGLEDDKETPSFVMEYLDGSSIAQLQRAISRDVEKGAARPERWMLLLYAGIAQSVSEVHTLHGAHDTTADSVTFIAGNSATVAMQEPKRGLVHRDLKPQNVQLISSGAIKILDFGMAHIDDNERDHTMTATGDVLGTPLYMAPELYDGGNNIKNATAASDVYAVGLMLFESLTGAHPFVHVSKDQVALLRAHRGEFPNFDRVRAGPLRTLLEAMFAKIPKARPTMSEVARVLHEEFLRDASPDEKLAYANFLSIPVAERRIPLPPELEISLQAAYVPTMTSEVDALAPETENLDEISPNDSSLEALSFSQRLVETVPNPEEPLLAASPGNVTYEVDAQTGKPRRVSARRRMMRNIAGNKWVQTLTGLMALTGAIAVGKTQFSGPSSEKEPSAPLVARENSVEEPKEQPLPHIPSLLRDRTPLEISENPPAFGVLCAEGKLQKVYAFGKVIDGKDLYQLAPPVEDPDQNMVIALGYMNDVDLAQSVFGKQPQDLQQTSPTQALSDISGTLGHQNKYGSAFDGRTAEGRELQIWHTDGCSLIMVQGVCHSIGGKDFPRLMVFTTEEFAPHLSHLRADADFRGSYPDPGAMMFEVYSQARGLQKLPSSDQMRSVSDEKAFAHLPVGENSGVDARLRKLARGVRRYIDDPTRVIQQNNQNKKNVSALVLPEVPTNNILQSPPQSP